MAEAVTKKKLKAPKAGKDLPQGQSDMEIYRKVNKTAQEGAGIGRPAGPSGSAADSTGAPLNADSGQTFPAHLLHSDPYDETFKMKQALLQAGRSQGPNSTPFGQAVLTADDMKAIERKAAMLQASHRLQWVMRNYNMNDPEQRRKLYKMLPQLKQDQLNIINYRAELQKKLAHLRLNGEPQSEEDLDLLYQLSIGVQKLPSGNLWDPFTWSDLFGESGTDDKNNIKRGLFSFNNVFYGGKPDAEFNPVDSMLAALGGQLTTERAQTDIPVAGDFSSRYLSGSGLRPTF